MEDKKRLIDKDTRIKRRPLWPLVLLVLILLVVAGYIWARAKHNNQDQVNQVQSPTTDNKTILTDFNSVYQTLDINDLDNRPIEIRGLVVRKQLSDQVLLVSTDSKNPTQMYLVGSGFNFKAGQKVDIKATLHKTPSVEEVMSRYGLKDADAQDFAKRLIYGEANEVTLAK